MTDIVERLREYSDMGLAGEAADEIERLRDAWQASIDDRGKLQDEIELLQKDLDKLRFRGERGWP